MTGPGIVATTLDAPGSSPRIAPVALAQPSVDLRRAASAPVTSGQWGAGGSLLLVALLAMAYAWWRATQRSHGLAAETERLERQQRQLKSAHTNLREKSEHLHKLSIHDPLTGTLNRQAFATELRELSEHVSRFARPLTLLMFDCDHFKAINDRQGHLAGDAALKMVVGIVREHLVSADLFSRFGGDEFLIACADQTLASAMTLAESVRLAVQRQAPLHEPPLDGLTLSIGIAQATMETGYLPEALFARADAALYAAKRSGRNCVVVASQEAEQAVPEEAQHRHL